MVDITRKVEVTVRLSAFDMGQAFAEMDGEAQAHFWGGVAVGTNKWKWEKPVCIQWQAMRDELEKQPDALQCFNGIAEYAGDFPRATDSAELLEALEGGLLNTAANLAAAISLLKRGGKIAAASDKMFAQMLVDYNASLDRARAILAKAGAAQ